MALRAGSFEIMPLTLVAFALLPATVAGAEIAGVHPAFLANAPALAVMAGLMLTWAYASWRRLVFVPVACEIVLIYMNIVLAALIYSYVALRPALPLADATLAAMDAHLGISAPAIVHWVDASHVLSWCLEVAYNSLGLQLAALPVLLAAFHSKDRAARMLVAQAAICCAGCTISIAWPAVGSFEHAGLRMQDLNHLGGAVGYQFHEGFFRARGDATFALTQELVSGVSTFPSIHAALAVACAWAAWASRWLRSPFLILNAGMYVSTVPVGAHYGIDVVAGTVLATVVILAVRRMPGHLWENTIAWPGRHVPSAAAAAPIA